jgi:lysozyme family protein
MAIDPFGVWCAFSFGPGRDGARQDSAQGEGFKTSYGVTQEAFEGAQRGRAVPADAVFETATEDQFVAALRYSVWIEPGCQKIYDAGFPKLAYRHAEFCAAAGSPVATRTLQKMVGAGVDGNLGPDTLAHIQAYAVHSDVERDYTVQQILFEASLGQKWTLFGKGWTGRVLDGRSLGA